MVRVGDKVICKDNTTGYTDSIYFNYSNIINIGKTYTIEKIFVWYDNYSYNVVKFYDDNEYNILYVEYVLKEMSKSITELSFNSKRFDNYIKVRKDKIKKINSIYNI